MRDFKGKGAFVTGGASGIGLALGRAFAAAGAKVMLADIEGGALDKAVAELKRTGAEARGTVCDVSDRAAVVRAASETVAAFGKVHILCNNAGVGVGGAPADQIAPADWDWAVAVNLMGVIHGIAAFLPHLRRQGEGGHIVNTASMAGMTSPPMMSPYNVTKFGVVTLSESLALELQGTEIGVSVLCPGWVNTGIADSARRRPARFGKAPEPTPLAASRRAEIAELLRSGMSPEEVAARVMAAIRDNDLYVFTHPEMRGAVEDRFRRILAGFDKAARFTK
jgi:NAD(P)-dependent dehydrogenase (short-subunit alcohol dehydrogenase family)